MLRSARAGLSALALLAACDAPAPTGIAAPLLTVVSDAELVQHVTTVNGDVVRVTFPLDLSSLEFCSLEPSVDNVRLEKLDDLQAHETWVIMVLQFPGLQAGCTRFTAPFEGLVDVPGLGETSRTFDAFPQGRYLLRMNGGDISLDRMSFTVSLLRQVPAGFDARVAFQSDRDGNLEIYAMNADGSGQVRLTDNPAADVAPAWSPDGTRIAFHSDRGGNFDVYVMNADGSNTVQLTGDPGFDGLAAWSPDGSKIAFQTNRDGNFEVYVMNADGTGAVNVTSNPDFDGFPSWSPDGARLAYQSSPFGNAEIFLSDADGTGKVNITTHASAESVPAWSPDGTLVLFHSNRDGGTFGVHVSTVISRYTVVRLNADGSQPAWSPDGMQVAFTTRRDGNGEIYAMAADGSGPVNLTNHPANESFADWGLVPSPAPPPHVLIRRLVDDVAQLVASGRLQSNSANGLQVKLEAAERRLAAGDTRAAINLVGAFINQVEALVNAGALAASDAQPLADAARSAITQLGDTP